MIAAGDNHCFQAVDDHPVKRNLVLLPSIYQTSISFDISRYKENEFQRLFSVIWRTALGFEYNSKTC